ncbi:hypothetical protein HAX54_028970 [Datura stramonium]|uniref:Uncharacterized protein n=1 Tax=Datura stramonium TaxID=4076 RepID=A0ABS8V5Y6_DATST|nr:hypothetical protein [Datura stramonium]
MKCSSARFDNESMLLVIFAKVDQSKGNALELTLKELTSSSEEVLSESSEEDEDEDEGDHDVGTRHFHLLEINHLL